MDPTSTQEFMDPSPSPDENIPATAERMKQSELTSESTRCEVSPQAKNTPDCRKRLREDDVENRPMHRTLGVKQIWVHVDYRRDNVARLLVDIARKNFIFGTVIMRPHIAFSQPTSEGLKFSLAYSKSETIWAYA